MYRRRVDRSRCCLKLVWQAGHGNEFSTLEVQGLGDQQCVKLRGIVESFGGGGGWGGIGWYAAGVSFCCGQRGWLVKLGASICKTAKMFFQVGCYGVFFFFDRMCIVLP